MSVRQRRLESDFARLTTLARESGGGIAIQETRGRPPTHYLVAFAGRGIEGVANDRIRFRDRHVVSIDLPSAYPSPAGRPFVKFTTPIWHPHVFQNGVVCLGSWPVNEFLDQLVRRVASLIAYDPQHLNLRSPANRDAARWAERQGDLFPLDQTATHRQRPARQAVTWRDLA